MLKLNSQNTTVENTSQNALTLELANDTHASSEQSFKEQELVQTLNYSK